MALKIEVAAATRRSPDFLIDARSKLYAKAGADMVLVESPETEDEMARIGGEIDAPLLANMVEGGRTPILPAARLQALGYAMAIYPALGFLEASGSPGTGLRPPARPPRQHGLAACRELRLRPDVHADGLPGCLGVRAQMGGPGRHAGGRRTTDELDIYRRQGFAQALGLGEAPALVIVDFVVGFTDPAIECTVALLALARASRWPVAHTRVVYADDGLDRGVFAARVPSLLTLTGASPLSQIVAELAPASWKARPWA